MTRLLDLPPEVLALICKHLIPPRINPENPGNQDGVDVIDLARTARACRELYQCCNPLLYQSITWASSDILAPVLHLGPLVRTLSEREDLARLTRRLQLIETGTGTVPLLGIDCLALIIEIIEKEGSVADVFPVDLADALNDNAPNQLRAAAVALLLCCHDLEDLALIGSWWDPGDWYTDSEGKGVLRNTFEALVTVDDHRQRYLSRLQSVRLPSPPPLGMYCEGRPQDGSEYIHQLLSLPRLQELEIDLNYGHLESATQELLLPKAQPHSWSSQTLTSLKLVHSVIGERFIGQILKHTPALRTFHLDLWRGFTEIAQGNNGFKGAVLREALLPFRGQLEDLSIMFNPGQDEDGTDSSSVEFASVYQNPIGSLVDFKALRRLTTTYHTLLGWEADEILLLEDALPAAIRELELLSEPGEDLFFEDDDLERRVSEEMESFFGCCRERFATLSSFHLNCRHLEYADYLRATEEGVFGWVAVEENSDRRGQTLLFSRDPRADNKLEAISATGIA